MAYVDTLKVFEILRPVFDEKQSAKIAEAVEVAIKTNNAELLNEVATKKEIIELKAELKTEIATAKAEIIKWTFVFIIGQFWAIIGALVVFFRK